MCPCSVLLCAGDKRAPGPGASRVMLAGAKAKRRKAQKGGAGEEGPESGSEEVRARIGHGLNWRR